MRKGETQKLPSTKGYTPRRMETWKILKGPFWAIDKGVNDY